MIRSKLFVLIVVFYFSLASPKFVNVNLPEGHLKYYFNSFPTEKKKCEDNPNCPYKDHLNSSACWGYEPECTEENSFSYPKCPGDHKGWVSSKQAQLETFYAQGDFGYVKDQRREMKIYCEPSFLDDSSLECSDHMRFCRGRNIMLNFTDLVNRKEPLRYKMDVLAEGQIGGYCKLNKKRLQENADHISPLQSWGPEMRHFRKLSKRPIVNGDCDIVVKKPTFIMKIDATVNLYHHFCDFFNLYAALHVNLSHPSNFDTDNHIMIWETYTYKSSFEDTFEAFTKNPLWDLKTFTGKTVCFKNVVFPLLPRMIFGLYYNTPLIYGCEKSGLFQAFSDHILHRLNIPLHQRANNKIRVTLLSRDTQFRRILNEDELIRSLKNHSDVEVQKAVFNRKVSFKQQLEIIRNTDILIGIHGAGLTHLLFLPEWAAVFELYNCEDAGCYKDLARLKGAKYFTWENSDKLVQQDSGKHPNGGAHAKFTNYSFDVTEFLRLVSQAKNHVRKHEKFIEFLQQSNIKVQSTKSENVLKESSKDEL